MYTASTVSKDNIWLYILSHTVKVYEETNEALEELRKHPSSNDAHARAELCEAKQDAWEEIVEEMIGLWSLEERSNVQ